MQETADAQTILENVKEVAERFAQERSERLLRRELVEADFDLLRDAGYPLVAVPVEQGGVWESVPRSIRLLCDILRTLAHGDPSVALVSAMHPAVIVSPGWLDGTQAPPPYTEAWEKQKEWVFQTARDGHFWGTIVSEPGSGGDPSKTRATAMRGSAEGEYLITGQKHFGSGSGMTSFMITTAIPEGETDPDTFFIDMRNRPWDGSAGVKLSAPWDGHGMTATQSHGLTFENVPATRSAWPSLRASRQLGGATGLCMFTAVITGVTESAMSLTRGQLGRKRDSMRPFEQVEWSRAEMDFWLIQQAYEGMLRAVEENREPRRNSVLGKETVAELSDSLLQRISKVVGGGAYSRHLPYGFWLQDVRALGFLRPPWGFAFDQIFDNSWEQS